MMATTHILVGMALAVLVTGLYPEQTSLIVVSGAIGGLFPDLDVFAIHRQSFHFPVYYSLLAALLGLIAVVWTTLWGIVGAVFVGAAALHSVSDIFGGSNELQPWKQTSDRAVYNHARGQWEHARRIIRYDGAPEDLLFATSVAIPVYLGSPPPFHSWIGLGLVISGTYVVARKPIGRFADEHNL